MDGDDGYIGKHNMLKLISHQSTSLNYLRSSQSKYDNEFLNGKDLSAESTIDYNLPRVCDFRFFRSWNFNAQQNNENQSHKNSHITYMN